MTTPTILPVGFAGTATDYLKVKVSKDGAAFFNASTVSVPTGTAVATIVGLMPVNAGARILVPGSGIATDGLGTTVTASIGIVYDDNANNTNVPALFAAATSVATAGAVPLTPSSANLPYIATANGWIVAVLGGATTTATGNIQSLFSVDYFSGGIQ